MLSSKIEKALNAQINRELFSSYLYFAMGAWFKSQDLDGLAHWMHTQAREELDHVNKLYDYVYERRCSVKLEAIEKPPSSWKSPLDAFEAAFKHELFITDHINKLMEAARAEKDHATSNILQWFVSEQVEEESSVDRIVKKLKMVEGVAGGLYMIDRELGQRQ